MIGVEKLPGPGLVSRGGGIRLCVMHAYQRWPAIEQLHSESGIQC